MKKTGPKNHKLMKDLSTIDLSIDQRPFQKALGDAHVNISPTPLGHYHLVTALKQRYGANYQHNVDSKKALDHFDQEKNRVITHARIRTGKIHG